MNFLLYEMIGNGVRQAKTVDEKIKYLIGWRRRLGNSGEETIINKINSTLTELYEIEPAIGSRLDYTAVSLENAKALVKSHKERLNKTRRG